MKVTTQKKEKEKIALIHKKEATKEYTMFSIETKKKNKTNRIKIKNQKKCFLLLQFVFCVLNLYPSKCMQQQQQQYEDKNDFLQEHNI